MAAPNWYASVPTTANAALGNDSPEAPDPVPTEGSLKRKAKEQRRLMDMNSFLKQYKFEDVNEPQQPIRTGCLCFGSEKEQLYPLHVAAKLGDPELVTSLLRSGANVDQLTSKGRTALQVAETFNVQESHFEVIEVLKGNPGKQQKETQSVLTFATKLAKP